MGNPVKQDRTLAPLSSSTQLALTHAPSGYTQMDADQMVLRIAPAPYPFQAAWGYHSSSPPCRLFS